MIVFNLADVTLATKLMIPQRNLQSVPNSFENMLLRDLVSKVNFLNECNSCGFFLIMEFICHQHKVKGNDKTELFSNRLGLSNSTDINFKLCITKLPLYNSQEASAEMTHLIHLQRIVRNYTVERADSSRIMLKMWSAPTPVLKY